jgi:hypothetical protein
MESSISKSAVLQGQAMEELLELRRILPSGQADVVKGIIKKLAASIEVQGFGRLKMNQMRREQVVKSLNPEFKSLLTATSPGDDLLFGAGLPDVLKDIEATNNLSARLSAQSRPSGSGSGQARNRRNSDSFLGRGQAPPYRKRDERFQRTYARKRPSASTWESTPTQSKQQVKER